jgi:hypothetical protein
MRRYFETFGRFLFLGVLAAVVCLLTMGSPQSYQRLLPWLQKRPAFPPQGYLLQRYPGGVTNPLPQPQESERPILRRNPALAEATEPATESAAPPATPIPVLTPIALIGKWGGSEILPNRGSCQIGMDIEPWNGEGYGAYTIVHCMPTTATQPRMNPGFTVLTGDIKGDRINMVARRTNITAQHSCVIRALSLRASPDDPDDMLATWVDTCSNATMHVKRVR